MPRKLPIPRADLEICHRLELARKATGKSRFLFAALLGIPVARLQSYERGAVKVPYNVALNFLRTVNVSQRWLATGELPYRPFVQLSPQFDTAIEPRTPFSQAYCSLKKSVDAHLATLADLGDPPPPSKYDPELPLEMQTEIFVDEITWLMKNFSNSERRRFVDSLTETAHRLVKLFISERETQKRPGRKS